MSTSSVNKRIAKNTIMLYIRSIIVLFITLFTSRECLSALGVIDYGLYNVVGGFVLLFSFLNNAMAVGTQRFLTYKLGEKNYKGFNDIFNASFHIHFGVVVLIVLLAETIGLWFVSNKLVIPDDRRFAALFIYHTSILSLSAIIIRIPYKAAIIAYERMDFFAYLSIIEAVSKLIIVYLLLISDLDRLILYGTLLSLISVLITFLYYFYCKKYFKGCSIGLKPDKSVLKEIVGFSSWNLFGSLALMGQNQGLNILLNMYFGPAVNAARAFAYQVNAGVGQFISSFLTASNPQITKQYASGNIDSSLNLMFRTSKFSFYLFCLFAIPLFLLMDLVLHVWLNEVPDYTIIFCRLILIVSAIDLFGYPLSVVIQATGKIKAYQMVVGLLLMLNLPISYVVLEMGSTPESVFIVSIFCSLITVIFRIVMLKRKISFKYKDYILKVVMPSLIVLFVVAFVSILGYSLINQNIIYQRIIITGINLFAFCIAVYIWGLNNMERNFIKNLLLKIMHKKD